MDKPLMTKGKVAKKIITSDTAGKNMMNCHSHGKNCIYVWPKKKINEHCIAIIAIHYLKVLYVTLKICKLKLLLMF